MRRKRATCWKAMSRSRRRAENRCDSAKAIWSPFRRACRAFGRFTKPCGSTINSANNLSVVAAHARFGATTHQTTGGNVMKAGILVVASIMAVAIVSAQAESVTKAMAVLSPTKGNSASGTVTFTKVDGGVKIVADVAGLTPGQHGFHIHEFGDCSAPDATSAGGHFNPHHMQHGAPDAAAHHAGDLGNLEADASGKAHYEFV